MRLVHSSCKNAELRCCIGKCEKIYSTSDSYRKHVEREHANELDLVVHPQQTSNALSDQSNSCEIMEVDKSDEAFPDPSDMGQLMQMLIENVSYVRITY